MAKIYHTFIFIALFELARGNHKDYAPLTLCCDIDDYFDTASFTCLPSNETLVPIFHQPDGSLERRFYMDNVTEMNTCDSYQLQSSQFVLRTDGSILVASKDKSKTYTVGAGGHCLLWMKSNEDYSFSTLICFPEQKTQNQFYHITHAIILPIGMAISAFCLVITFIVYCLLHELRDQIGKSFMCSIACLCLSKVLAIIIKTSSGQLPIGLCIFTGLAMHVCFLQAFFWLNVISILVFTSLWLRGTKFCLDSKSGYIASCLYAFGIPILILIFIILHDFSSVLDHLPFPIPGFGIGSCWFSNRGAQLVYFYAPIAIIVSINAILFCLSAGKLCALSSITSSIHFKQYLKLFILMGISWIFEVLSFFFGNPTVPSVSSYIWFILDLFNALSGVFIFIFFACRQTALNTAYDRMKGEESLAKRFVMSSTTDDRSKTETGNRDDKVVEPNNSLGQRLEP